MTLTASMILSHTQPLKATNIQEEQKKQEDLKKNIESATQILSELEKLKTDTENYIVALDARMTELTTYIIELNSKISDKEKEIATINEELDAQQKSIDEQYAAMKLRIQYLYENGNQEYVNMLLDSGGIEEMLNKAEYLTSISKYYREFLFI